MEISKKNNSYKVTSILLIIYLFILTFAIVFKMGLAVSGERSINLIPYGSSVIVNGRLYTKELIENVIAFIPLGCYIGMLKADWSFIKKIFPIFGVSLLFEITQFIFGLGASDVTDLINNTLGGAIGILIYFILIKIFKSDLKLNKVINIFSSLATICLVLLLTILIINN
ncbi:VanZ-like protein [[Clostridium] sordellii]|uniref:VanZ family protein n=1 Tax=Paraclostridium sordellii TaxID=1505 RepID=UPI0005E7055C|nr:VanZ family protein [Paeniclostridium sordellii]CEP45928.1 VanZ-like protein [[Clostridium] sordellii] [Paeniclostridium sordellii]